MPARTRCWQSQTSSSRTLSSCRSLSHAHVYNLTNFSETPKLTSSHSEQLSAFADDPAKTHGHAILQSCRQNGGIPDRMTLRLMRSLIPILSNVLPSLSVPSPRPHI